VLPLPSVSPRNGGYVNRHCINFVYGLGGNYRDAMSEGRAIISDGKAPSRLPIRRQSTRSIRRLAASLRRFGSRIPDIAVWLSHRKAYLRSSRIKSLLAGPFWIPCWERLGYQFGSGSWESVSCFRCPAVGLVLQAEAPAVGTAGRPRVGDASNTRLTIATSTLAGNFRAAFKVALNDVRRRRSTWCRELYNSY
jgi:hypothetical protein